LIAWASGSPLWIIRGAPGVGKSTVARAIKERFATAAVVEVDALRAMRSTPAWLERKSQLLGIGQALILARSFAEADFDPVILVDTLAPEVLRVALADVAGPAWVFTLVADPLTLLERVRTRAGSGFRDERVICAMDAQNRAIPTSPQNERIDTTNATPEDVAEIIIGLAGAASRSTGPIARRS
jgi:broad-specificity NMP kinase